MRILSIGNCELSPFLGSGKTRLRWSEGFRALGHEFDTLAPDDFEWMPGLPSLKRLRLAHGARLRMLRALREKPYDIVEFCGGELGWATRALAGLRQRPMIIARTDGLELLAYYDGKVPNFDARGHHLSPRHYYNRLVYECDYDAFRCADRFASLSWQDQRFVVGAGLFETEQTTVVAPGIDTEFMGRDFTPGAPKHLAYAGSWIERKNPEVIVRVVTALLAKRTDLIFDVFGASGAAEVILNSFPENLRSRVKVHPKLPTSELAAGLSAAALFFFPSRYEGFGMTVAEAMGCGCAVVTTPTGFGAELQDGVEALICDFQDTAGMEKDIGYLLDHEEERLAIARAGWERVQNLQWDAQVAKLESSYQGWLDAWPSGASAREGRAAKGLKILTFSNCPLDRVQGSGYITMGFGEGLRDRGHSVELFGPDQCEPLQFLKKAKGYRLSLGIASRALWRALRFDYDVMEFYGGECWLAIALLSRLEHRRFLIIQHSNGLEPLAAEKAIEHFGTVSLDGRGLKWYQRLIRVPVGHAFTKPDGMVIVSQSEMEYALVRQFQAPDRLLKIDNALPEAFLDQPLNLEREKRITYCGSWLPMKGSETIREDMTRILEEFPEWKLRLVGVGEGFHPPAVFPKEICDRVDVVPFEKCKEKLRALYRSAAISIAPSVCESFGLVVAEAMACGCAVVTTRTGFAAHLRHREEVMLMETSRPPYLYDAVKELILNDELRRRVAGNGYARVQNLRWETSISILEDHYAKWLWELHHGRSVPNQKLPVETPAALTK